uniref:3CxxC-type domain-containing protein n=1 Tax=Capra hircus TaxID=9925 RepID=A0A8C2QXR9_CAPHI
MERVFCVPYSLYPGCGNMLRLGQSGLSEHRQPHWRQTNVPPTFLARPRLLMPSSASDCCMDPYKRAQLMAVFSHMNPGLSLRLRKANTKDVGVQFLEPKYGYFHCKDCKTRWESAYVWCISGTNKVYFKQLCCKCQKSFNPYRVEAIQCQTCSKSRCSCPQKKRHINLRRPHRQELCGRCKDKRFSCGSIYSFKYIM